MPTCTSCGIWLTCCPSNMAISNRYTSGILLCLGNSHCNTVNPGTWHTSEFISLISLSSPECQKPASTNDITRFNPGYTLQLRLNLKLFLYHSQELIRCYCLYFCIDQIFESCNNQSASKY